MTTTLWIALAVAAVFAVGYFYAMRNLLRKSRDEEKRIDFRKIRRWKDDDR